MEELCRNLDTYYDKDNEYKVYLNGLCDRVRPTLGEIRGIILAKDTNDGKRKHKIILGEYNEEHKNVKSILKEDKNKHGKNGETFFEEDDDEHMINGKNILKKEEDDSESKQVIFEKVSKNL
ncbi:unnamed protein product [Meloidogyne enterolobii]|uniref:Uncharacterized protein n=1 Tax=Meloidogyne enterolobii TaxID=390850 RepID=A0ACB0ZFU4_MELEN